MSCIDVKDKNFEEKHDPGFSFPLKGNRGQDQRRIEELKEET